jgi:hypothetical protein
MLDYITKTKMYSVLAADITSTNTVVGDSGIYVSLAANTMYEISSLLLVSGDTDGIRITYDYSGTLTGNDIGIFGYDGGTTEITFDAEYTLSSLVSQPLLTVNGVITTSTAGILKVRFRKNTDLGADTTIKAGSYLIARLMP